MPTLTTGKTVEILFEKTKETYEAQTSMLPLVTFEEPDVDKFPCLHYAYKSGEIGGTMPTVLNAANEIAVDAFLREKISFLDIPRTIKHVMDTHEVQPLSSLDDAIEADRWARKAARTAL